MRYIFAFVGIGWLAMAIFEYFTGQPHARTALVIGLLFMIAVGIENIRQKLN